MKNTSFSTLVAAVSGLGIVAGDLAARFWGRQTPELETEAAVMIDRLREDG